MLVAQAAAAMEAAWAKAAPRSSSPFKTAATVKRVGGNNENSSGVGSSGDGGGMGVCSPSLLIAVRDRSDDGVGGIPAAPMEAAWA